MCFPLCTYLCLSFPFLLKMCENEDVIIVSERVENNSAKGDVNSVLALTPVQTERSTGWSILDVLTLLYLQLTLHMHGLMKVISTVSILTLKCHSSPSLNQAISNSTCLTESMQQSLDQCVCVCVFCQKESWTYIIKKKRRGQENCIKKGPDRHCSS